MTKSVTGNHAPRNRSVRLSADEETILRDRVVRWQPALPIESLINRTLQADSLEVSQWLPDGLFDLVIADPPYNAAKDFRSTSFRRLPRSEYLAWLERWLSQIRRLLKTTGTLYVCGDWQSSGIIQEVCERYFTVRNRITWEREKGRGAQRNWKNCAEDIWFCTVSKEYHFDVEAVKLKRRVVAPYRDSDGSPRDWNETEQGNFRITYPSNLWTDVTVPFWSMPENTEHPTQKPEKLFAKLILASSRPGDLVFDPFLGSGTTSAVAKKLGRNYIGVELDGYYCCLAEKRILLAEDARRIQGYTDGVFWDRNVGAPQSQSPSPASQELIGQAALLDV
jgi:site-specific DNA-methyltransferase (adenine-specific)